LSRKTPLHAFSESSRVVGSVSCFLLTPQAVFVLGLAVLACAEEKKEEPQGAVPAEKKQDKRGLLGLGYGAAPALSYAAPALAPSVLAHAPAISYAAPALAAPAVSYAAPALTHAPAVSFAAPALAHAPAAVSTQASFFFVSVPCSYSQDVTEGSQLAVPTYRTNRSNI
jgi:hypothetical protein